MAPMTRGRIFNGSPIVVIATPPGTASAAHRLKCRGRYAVWLSLGERVDIATLSDRRAAPPGAERQGGVRPGGARSALLMMREGNAAIDRLRRWSSGVASGAGEGNARQDEGAADRQGQGGGLVENQDAEQ